METILLSIKPEYAEKILAGTKKYEYRRRLANRPVNKIVVYITEPFMQIVGEVQVLNTLSGAPTSLWERTKENAGICRAKYRNYFKGCKYAYAYHLGNIVRYESPKKLAEINIHQPPQSFIYLSDKQVNSINKS